MTELVFKIGNGERWEDIPAAFALDVSDLDWDDCVELGDNVATRLMHVVKNAVRWNFRVEGRDLCQGHYIDPF